MFFVYILQGESSHYIGYTSDLEKRLERHKQGTTATTKKMKNVILLGYFIKETKQDAIKLEKMIKRNGHIDHRIQHETFIKAH